MEGAGEKVTVRLILGDPAVRVVVLLVFVIMLGFGIIAPILPLYARSFGVSYDVASLLISAFALARLVFDPVAGPIVDRRGERLSAMIGVVFVGVSTLLAGLAKSFALVVLFRGIGGLGSSLFFAALYSYLLKVVPSQRMGRTMSVFYGSLNVGIIAGGPIGGVVAHVWGLRSPLFVYAGLCLVSGVLYLRFMPDPDQVTTLDGHRREHTGPIGWRATRSQIATLLRDRTFLTVILLNMVFFWVVAGGYDTLVPLFGKERLGMSTVGVGGVFAIAVTAEFLVLYPAGAASDRYGRKRVLVPALAGLAVMTAVTGWAATPLMLGILMGVLGLTSGSAASGPAAMLADVAPSGGSGTAVGVFRFFGDLGFVLGPVVAGASASAFGFKGAFAVMALPVALVLILVARTPETLRIGTGVHARRPPPSLDEEPGLI
jgi:DHA1 family multidrug resistance protein-like MFS transporter